MQAGSGQGLAGRVLESELTGIYIKTKFKSGGRGRPPYTFFLEREFGVAFYNHGFQFWGFAFFP